MLNDPSESRTASLRGAGGEGSKTAGNWQRGGCDGARAGSGGSNDHQGRCPDQVPLLGHGATEFEVVGKG